MTLSEDPASAEAASSEARSRWNAKYEARAKERDVEGTVGGAPPALIRLFEAAGLAESVLAIDLAGGDGSGALWLASQGLTPGIVEVSDVALGLAKNRAAVAGFDLMTAQVDLEDQTLNSVLDRVLTAWSVDESPIVLSCFHYLNRTLLASVADGLPPGATFMASIATAKNLERHSKPSARFLLDPGELRALVAGMGPSDHPENLSLIHYFEGWNAEGNHEAEIIVRRPRHSSDWAERPMHKVRSQR